MDENSTRKNLIVFLKKSGGMSIEELSRLIDITPMGIRQHLLALEKKGIVTYVAKRRGIGRPGFVYMLTERADELFSKSYDDFAVELLRDIRKYEGQEKIDMIFNWRRERLLKLRQNALSGKENLEDQLAGLKQILEAEGHFVEISRNNGHYHLKKYNCPIKKVSDEFSEVCTHELRLYQDLINENITRVQTQSEGSPSCLYVIPRN